MQKLKKIDEKKNIYRIFLKNGIKIVFLDTSLFMFIVNLSFLNNFKVILKWPKNDQTALDLEY